MYVVSGGRRRGGRADHLRPRVHPRAPGPELRRLQGPAGRDGPERLDPRPAGDLRGRRDALMTYWALAAT